MGTAFAIAASSAAVGGILSELAFLPKLVIATEVAAQLADARAAGQAGAAQYYAVLITIIDMGDAISLQLSAPIVQALGITYDNFVRLPDLVGVQAASSAAVLFVIGLLWLPKWPQCQGRRHRTAACRE